MTWPSAWLTQGGRGDELEWSELGSEQPRLVADLTGDGRADIVGFGLDGVWASLNNGNGTFQPPNMVLCGFNFHTGWMVERHPRFLADLTGDGRADIIGFGDAGVWTARNNGDGTFQAMKFVVADLGYDPPDGCPGANVGGESPGPAGGSPLGGGGRASER